jgi:hypothetical protein
VYPFERDHAWLCLVKLGNDILADDALLLIYATKPLFGLDSDNRNKYWYFSFPDYRMFMSWLVNLTIPAQRTLAGIELMRMLEKGQMKCQSQRGKSPAELYYALAG